jgi:hypothetical protein
MDDSKKNKKSQENTKSDNIVISQEHSKYIFYLSFLGFFTGLTGVYYKKPILGSGVCTGSLIALNYWRNPVYGWRRNLDMFWVSTFFVAHLINAWNTPIINTYLLLQGKGIFLYYASWYFQKKNKLGLATICHGGLHVCTNISLLIYYTLC